MRATLMATALAVRGLAIVCCPFVLLSCSKGGSSQRNSPFWGGSPPDWNVVLPVLPAPLPAQAATAEAAASELAERVLGGGQAALPSLLAALQASGIAVIDPDRSVLVAPASPAQGWAIERWEALAMGLNSDDQPLITANALLQALVPDVPLEVTDDAILGLVKDIRALASSDNPTLRFLGLFIVELGRHGSQQQDLMADIAPADVSFNMVQVELVLRRLVADLAILSRKLAAPAAASRNALRAASLPSAASTSALPCQLSELQSMILDSSAIGSTFGIDITIEKLIAKQGLYGLESVSKVTGIANVLLAYLKLYLYYANLKVDLSLTNGEPLVRTHHTVPGEKDTIVADVSFDVGDKQILNCFRIVLNMAGMDLSLPTSGKVTGSPTEWILLEGGSPDSSQRIVELFGDPEHGHTDESGRAQIGIEGAAQKQEIPDSAPPVMKSARVRFLVAPKASSFSQDIIDATAAGAGGPVGLVGTAPAEMILRSRVLKPHDLSFQVKDWAKSWTGTITFTQSGDQSVTQSDPVDGGTHTVTTTGHYEVSATAKITGLVLDVPYYPGFHEEETIELDTAITASNAQKYQRHEHTPGVCDTEGGCPTPPPDYDDIYVEQVAGSGTQSFADGAAVFLHLKPDGSYTIELSFQPPDGTGTWSDSYSGTGGPLVTSSQPVHLAVTVSGGPPNPTSLNNSDSEPIDLQLSSIRGAVAAITVPTTLTMTWDLKQGY